jgi:hypothetical protein
LAIRGGARICSAPQEKQLQTSDFHSSFSDGRKFPPAWYPGLARPIFHFIYIVFTTPYQRQGFKTNYII